MVSHSQRVPGQQDPMRQTYRKWMWTKTRRKGMRRVQVERRGRD